MNESQIAQQLQAKIPQPVESNPTPSDGPPEATGFGNATLELDELTQYKLHDVFDIPYKPNDNEARQQLQYIYEKVGDMVDNKEYPFIAAKMRELMRIAGIQHSERKLYKLYEFLRLSNVMKKTDAEREALRSE